VRAFAVFLVLAACHERPPAIASCRDPLGGVWREHEGVRRYHILDDGKIVALFPMWDTTRLPDGGKPARPARSPLRIELQRAGGEGDGDALDGKRSFRLTTDEGTCSVAAPVSLRSCRDGRMIFVTIPDEATLGCHPDVSPSEVQLDRE
jgi:hypothetical protein